MFQVTFGVLSVICLFLSYVLKQDEDKATQGKHGTGNSNGHNHTQKVNVNKDFKRFSNLYLIVFLTMMAGDWIQGPYVYALYQSYGFDRQTIAFLFVMGFLSSALLGTIVGSFADSLGRKKASQLLCITYMGSCLTKMSPNIYVLFFGRLLGGISTSLLHSAPEAWMVAQHHKLGFDHSLIADTFSWATWGNGLAAILSGVLADFVFQIFEYRGPFIAAIGFFLAGAALITLFWQENYGQSEDSHWLSSLKAGFHSSKSDIKIVCLGAIQSLFEGAMYSFVFMWTPALQRGNDGNLPYGIIFSCYMLSVMCGSTIFGHLARNTPVETIAPFVYLLGSVALIVPFFTENLVAVFFSFLIFEMMCGIHWPLLGTLRGKYIPDQSRSAVMNLMRVPLNFIVATVLLGVSSVSIPIVFFICSSLLVTCSGFALLLKSHAHQHVHSHGHKK